MKIKYILFIILFFSSLNLFSQGGMKFVELAQRLEPYFDKDLIMDIKSQLPQGNDLNIWGWDVGDFSGDGNNDVAFSVKMLGDKRRTMQVFMFVDIDGFLRKVAQIPVDFVEMPLEVGVVIRSEVCHITKKNKQFDWLMLGYSYDNGCILKHEEFATSRVGEYTYEKSRDYVALKGSERYLLTKNNSEKFYKKYSILPSYTRGRLVYKGFSNELISEKVENVFAGAFYWQGETDLSYTISSAYDDEFIYFTVDINDDEVIGSISDSLLSDHIEMWFDLNSLNQDYDKFTVQKKDKITFKNKLDSGIINISVYPGDFYDKPAFVKVKSDDKLDVNQKSSIRYFKAISNYTDDGYILKFKIPIEFLGIKDFRKEDKSNFEISFSSVVWDFDNEFRPEEVTKMSISDFNEYNPASYSSLLIIPKDSWYGASENIYIDDIVKNLIEFGF